MRAIFLFRQKLHARHFDVLNNFRIKAEAMNKEVVVKNELTATKKDVEKADLVISLGGDHTFLRTSAIIEDSTPIVGITTNRDMYTGALNGHFIDHKHRAEQS